MNQSNSQTTTISSGHITNAIESQIVQLCGVVQIENSCSIEDAMETVRDYLLQKQYALLTDNDKNEIIKIRNTIKERIKKKKHTPEDTRIYEVLQCLGVNKHI